MKHIDLRVFLSEKEQQKRLNICQECSWFLKQEVVCSNCGCPLKLKSKIKGFHCPDKKW